MRIRMRFPTDKIQLDFEVQIYSDTFKFLIILFVILFTTLILKIRYVPYLNQVNR
jgi:hypothetical protein